MTLNIGRLALDDGFVDSISDDGSRLSINGRLYGDDIDLLASLRDRLLGTLETAVVPLAWDEDPGFTGYYKVVGGGASQAPGALREGLVPASIELERFAGGHALPGIESILQGGYRPNSVGVTNVVHAAGGFTAGVDLLPEWYVPASSREILTSIAPTMGASGPANDVYRFAGFPSGYFTTTTRWAVDAADYYEGACLIEELVGATWVPVIGRQPIVTDTAKIRISNGYMGATFRHPSNATELGLRFAGFGRTAGVLNWTQRGTFIRLSPNGPLNAANVTAISVLRNDPEEIRLRFSGVQGSAVWTFFTMDLSLRRGCDYVTAVFPAGWVGGVAGVKLDATANLAATSTAEGIYQTTAAGGARLWALGTALAATDTTVGTMQGNGGGAAVALGLGPVWAPYVADSTAGGSKVHWFAPLTERQRFVGR